MKRRNLSLFSGMTAMVLLMTSIAGAHKQEMHQYMVREAFKLLKKSFPNSLAAMEPYVGSFEKNNENAGGAGKMVAGAWDEDVFDVVHWYGDRRSPDYETWVSIPDALIQLSDNDKKAYTSVTHFWDADGGKNSGVRLSDQGYLAGVPVPWAFNIPENAFSKTKLLESGLYNFLYQSRPIKIIQLSPTSCGPSNTVACTFPGFNPVATWKTTEKHSIKSNLNITIPLWIDAPCYSWTGDRASAAETFGRMCHLLEDMSVPEHVHCDDHAKSSGMRSSFYEDNQLSYRQWTADEIWRNGQKFINPFFNNVSGNDPIYNLMYVLNQVTDHYASCSKNGDDTYDTQYQILAGIIPKLKQHTVVSEINDANCRMMHDVLQPLTIRAVAGLMYWYACQIGLLSPTASTDNTETVTSPYISYSFNNAFSGLLTDNSGFGHTATAWSGPVFGNAYEFSGTAEEYVTYGPMTNFYTASTPNAGSVSMSGWFKSSVDPTGKNMMLFGFGQPAYQANFQVGTATASFNGVTSFRVNGWGSSYDWYTSVNPVPYFNGQWHHVAVTYDKETSTTRLYLDGAQKDVTSSYVYNIDRNNAYTVIGNEIDYCGWHFNGSIDNFKAYSRVLSSTEVNNQFKESHGIAIAASDFSASTFLSQQHVAFRDGSGKLWDSYYSPNQWYLQQINLPGGATNGPAVVGMPSVSVYATAQHFAYRDNSGKIWDSWYDGTWRIQQLNLTGGKTPSAPAAAGNPFSTVGGGYHHFLYRDVSGAIWNIYYNNTWYSQKLNLGGRTRAPSAVGDPVYSEDNFGYQHNVYRGINGTIVDCYYSKSSGWLYQQINLGGKTGGPAAAGDPCVGVYGKQQHILYRDASGKIWDSWYDGAWGLQQLNLGGKTNAPAAASDPAYYAESNGYQHNVYRDASGRIWDCWYSAAWGWQAQQINLGGKTTGPAAVGEPTLSLFNNNQMHYVYRDAAGDVWDAYYDTSWHLQQLNP